jgi:microsomal dipeptidase-like Zn-dependent dipeptidase
LPSLDDEIYFRIISELGVFTDEHETVRNLIKKEFKEEFLNLYTQFMSINKFKETLQGKARILRKDRIKPDLEFQRAVSHMLSLVGYKIVELGDTFFGTIKRSDGSHLGDVDVIAQDTETRRMYAIQCTISPPNNRKIDVIANIANELRMRGLPIEPLIFVRDFATEVKKNTRRVKVIDIEDLLNILKQLRTENVKEAKRILAESLP